MDDDQFSGRARPFLAEIATAVGVAVIVAAAVVAVGMSRDEPPARALSSGPAPQTSTPAGTEPSATESSESAPSEDETEQPEASPTVTKIDLSVDPADYTGPCPVTVTISASIFTDTGPVTAHYRWIRDGEPGVEETVRFGGPGPQRVTVTDTLDAVDDVDLSESLQVSAPNEVTATPVNITVTCTPTAQTWLEFDSICATPHPIVYRGAITVPHGPMTVKYVWERSDGASAPTQTLDVPAGGEQSFDVQNTWTVGAPGEYSQRIKILQPHEYTSNWSTFTMEC